MLFVEVVNELKSIILKPGVPREVADSLFKFLKCPLKSCFIKVSVCPATGTLGLGMSLHPSDGLLQILAAARAEEWEAIIVFEAAHKLSSQEPNNGSGS